MEWSTSTKENSPFYIRIVRWLLGNRNESDTESGHTKQSIAPRPCHSMETLNLMFPDKYLKTIYKDSEIRRPRYGHCHNHLCSSCLDETIKFTSRRDKYTPTGQDVRENDRPKYNCTLSSNVDEKMVPKFEFKRSIFDSGDSNMLKVNHSLKMSSKPLVTGELSENIMRRRELIGNLHDGRMNEPKMWYKRFNKQIKDNLKSEKCFDNFTTQNASINDTYGASKSQLRRQLTQKVRSSWLHSDEHDLNGRLYYDQQRSSALPIIDRPRLFGMRRSASLQIHNTGPISRLTGISEFDAAAKELIQENRNKLGTLGYDSNFKVF